MSCIYCGKKFKRIEKHVILCEIMFKSKKQVINEKEEELDIPSQKKMFKMLLVMATKYNDLEKKVAEVHAFVQKKTKKINILDYLNQHIYPTISINEWISIEVSDVEYLFMHSVFETFSKIFDRCISSFKNEKGEREEMPITAFLQKSHTLYGYYKEKEKENQWSLLSNKELTLFLEFIQFKLSKELYEWKKRNKKLIDENDSKCMVYDKTVSKLMSPNFKNDSTLKKYQEVLYIELKKDIKSYIEYEFE